MADIAHVFVLVMENRSFDHLFGLSGIDGVKAPDDSWGFSDGAADRLTDDPPHEFDDVQKQLSGTPPMSGFRIGTSADIAMRGFRPPALPVVSQLAQHFVLFDNWFSSMPGPTWPNRFFVHAASSGGLDNSPSAITSIESDTIDSLGFSFDNGTIFEHLTAQGKKWRVYHADAFPQVLAIKGLVGGFFHHDTFRSIEPGAANDDFKRDLASEYNIDYTFIEPDYGLLSGNFATGNSQHPVGSIAAGELFIKYVYETIRNSPIWQSSILLVTWDEHGGFFDHKLPPTAKPPGDRDTNSQRAQYPRQFPFNKLGVRVPALLISPWVPGGQLGSQLFPPPGSSDGVAFDHASIVRSVRETFGIIAPLTQRDATSPSWTGALLNQRRANGSDGPLTLDAPSAPTAASARTSTTSVTANHIGGFAIIAHALDLQMAKDNSSPAAIHDTNLFAHRLRPAVGASPTNNAAASGAGSPAANTVSPRALADYVTYIARQTKGHKRR
ncbi:alkaline phosphatase family protein [Paraburkholderia phymatum]|uniref:Phospholipase C n=1 Tax=Paraburkholderia phymatum (strain DSM 17167 / CIP 108236 / LMG 21445 / STM815) TaxID=391038 RepID=B2JTP6_PARP8|nr:alkaline phosphatase family protein [Paraburkholderia phymatum]ACC75949.1 Phospholipase C [Paraburkholderia phymatum STM815]